jgi:hypothetical protein
VGANGNGVATTSTPAVTGASAISTVSVTAQPPLNLVAVSNLTAQTNAASVMQLNWTDTSTQETGYRIQRCTGSIATTCAPAAAGWANVTTGLATTGTPTPLGSGPVQAIITANLAQNTINYRVYPLNGAAPGPVSNTVSVNLNGNPTAPNTVVATPAVGSVGLTWVDASNNNISFVVRSRYALTFAANGTPTTLTAAQIGGIYVAGRTFQFQVGARNQAGTNYGTSANVVVQ